MRLRLLPPNFELGWTPFAWLIYLSFLLVWPFAANASAFVFAVTFAATALFLPLYFYGFWVSGTRLLAVVGAILAIAMVTTPVNPGGLCFFIYAAAFVGGTGPPRVAVRRLGILLAVTALEAWWLRWPPGVWLSATGISAIIGGTNIHFAEMHRKDAKLRVAQRAVEEMARIAERERIGRDLHDLLGHTLSLIVLKSELASRLADRDPARAVEEIRDVERISREALGEVRKAVVGYRGEGLHAELANAARVLEAAGLKTTFDVEPLALPADEDRALAFALREAVTNVIRHAGATRCVVRLAAAGGRALLEVRDDGRGGLAPEGSGLSGMRERLHQVAGTLERDGRDGTRLVASLPLPAAGGAGS